MKSTEFSAPEDVLEALDPFELLREALVSRERQRKLAAQSYKHANGFLKIQLGTYRSCRLRLHLWAVERASVTTTTVHNHRWNIASRILCGEVLNKKFRLDDLGRGALYRSYLYTPSASSDRLSPVGEQSLSEVESSAFTSGDTYKLEWSDLHQTRAKEGAVTLVATGQYHSDNTMIYVPIHKVDLPEIYGRVPLSLDSYRAHLASVLSRCVG